MKINFEKLNSLINFTPHEYQNYIINSPARTKVICAGRRFGKSILAAYLALITLLQDDKRIWIVAPSYDLTQKVFNYLVRWFLLVAPSQKKGITYRPFPKIKTARGSIVECKSTENPTSLLGEEVDLLIGDEASRWQRRIWEAYIFPVLASRRGKVILISTPLGKNWFYELYLSAKEEGGAFRFRSIDNPFFPRSEWERAKKMLPQDVFAQEYEAKFLDDAAAVFRNLNEIIGENILQDAQKGRVYVMGVDLAKYRDFSVIVVIDTLTHNVVYFDRFQKLDWGLQKNRIISAAKRYNNARVIIDSTGVGDPITDDLRNAGLVVDDFKFGSVSKQQLIQKLQLFIEQKEITIPPINVLIDELESFGYEITSTGHMKFSAPQGLHDDCVIALALAVWGLRGKKRERNLMQEQLLEGRKLLGKTNLNFI